MLGTCTYSNLLCGVVYSHPSFLTFLGSHNLDSLYFWVTTPFIFFVFGHPAFSALLGTQSSFCAWLGDHTLHSLHFWEPSHFILCIFGYPHSSSFAFLVNRILHSLNFWVPSPITLYCWVHNLHPLYCWVSTPFIFCFFGYPLILFLGCWVPVFCHVM